MKDIQLTQIQNAASRAGTDNDRRRLLASLSVAMSAGAVGASAEDRRGRLADCSNPACSSARCVSVTVRSCPRDHPSSLRVWRSITVAR